MTCALKYRNLRLGQVKSEPNIPVFEFRIETRFEGSNGVPSPSLPVCQQEQMTGKAPSACFLHLTPYYAQSMHRTLTIVRKCTVPAQQILYE